MLRHRTLVYTYTHLKLYTIMHSYIAIIYALLNCLPFLCTIALQFTENIPIDIQMWVICTHSDVKSILVVANC